MKKFALFAFNGDSVCFIHVLLNALDRKAKEQGLFEGACKACSTKLGVAEAVQKEELPMLSDMSGHPGMSHYLAENYEIITF